MVFQKEWSLKIFVEFHRSCSHVFSSHFLSCCVHLSFSIFSQNCLAVLIFSKAKNVPVCLIEFCLKVKCNEIWTIFLLSKNLYKKVSYTIMKQNQLLKISFVRTAAPKTRKTAYLRELYENEPEMAALEWKRNYRYL